MTQIKGRPVVTTKGWLETSSHGHLRNALVVASCSKEEEEAMIAGIEKKSREINSFTKRILGRRRCQEREFSGILQNWSF